MPDAFSAALATPGLGWLIAAAFVAGTVRGFAGFGTAMIFMPVAARFLDPFWAILAIVVMDIVGPIPNIPSVMRVVNRGDLVRLVSGALIGVPLGLMALSLLSPDMFRLGVSAIALGMLICLLVGVRYRGSMGPLVLFSAGGLGGMLGGVSGQPGPPVILLYMSSKYPAPMVRAMTMAYLFFYDILMLLVLSLQKILVLVPVLLGLFLAVPNLLGNMVGARLFRPGYEKIYRTVAYVIIAISALSGLPVWG